jgi:hypothetical protein
MLATGFPSHKNPWSKLCFYISWPFSFWIATYKTNNSKPNDSSIP